MDGYNARDLDGMKYQVEWREVLGEYEVSNTGLVRSMGTKKLLVLRLNEQGYFVVQLRLYGGNRNCLVHRVVANAFIENPRGAPCINHKDGVRHNNFVENLEWVTHSENSLHGIHVLGTERPKGERHGRTKLTNEQVLEIAGELSRVANGRRRAPWGSLAVLAKKHGVSQSVISQIWSGKHWSHVTGIVR